jgi:hypothetical protein
MTFFQPIAHFNNSVISTEAQRSGETSASSPRRRKLSRLRAQLQPCRKGLAASWALASEGKYS